MNGFDLERFVSAHDAHGAYLCALEELRAGQKRSHWIWFIFPQIEGLGRSETARFFAISGIAEAQAYLAHEILGPRLEQCTQAMLAWAGKRTAASILGEIDALKFCSSMTLFEAAGGGECFAQALDIFYSGCRDTKTLELLRLS